MLNSRCIHDVIQGQGNARVMMGHLAAYDDVNPVMGDGDDEMEDEQEEIPPSGPGLVNPLLMRRMSQASRGIITLNHHYTSTLLCVLKFS